MRSMRNPEHTGENRCWPCTVVNLGIAAALSLAVAVYSPPVAGAVFALSAGVIAYAGYLVPGTPYLTRRLLPARVLSYFGKAPPGPVSARADGAGTEVDRLVVADVLEEHDDGTLSLSPSFASAWDGRIEALRDDPEAQRAAFASMVGADPDAVSFEEINETGALSVDIDGGGVSQWISSTALLADVAASETLASRDATWQDAPVQQRHETLVGLRQFRDACPACGGALVEEEEGAATCCWTQYALTARCESCGDRLYVITEHPE